MLDVPQIVILTKFLVSPDIALDFIKAIKLVKDSAKETDGNEIYSLVKTKVCEPAICSVVGCCHVLAHLLCMPSMHGPSKGLRIVLLVWTKLRADHTACVGGRLTTSATTPTPPGR